MPIKRKLTKEEFEAIESADLKSLYKEGGDGNFGLELEEDQALVNALSRTKEEIAKKTTEHTEAIERLRLAEQHIAELKAAEGKGKAYLSDIEEAWKQKLKTVEEKAAKAQEEQLVKIREAAIESQAAKISAEICVAPELMTSVIAKRLTADFHEGNAIIRVLDKDGKPSALSLTELADEFKKDSRYEKVIIASKASGGATTPASAASHLGSAASISNKTKMFSEMTADELAAHAAAHAKVAKLR